MPTATHLARYADQTPCAIGDVVRHELITGDATGTVLAVYHPRAANGADHGQALVRWDTGELRGDYGHGCYYLHLAR